MRLRSAAIARRSSSSRACCARSAFSASSRVSIVWFRSVLPTTQGTIQKKVTGKKMSLGVVDDRQRQDHRDAERQRDHARAAAHVAPRRVAQEDDA